MAYLSRKGWLPITRREWVIAELVVEGKTTAEIAAELCLSGKTVEAHRHALRGKLGAKTPAHFGVVLATALAARAKEVP